MPAADQDGLVFDIEIPNDPNAPSAVRRFLEELGPAIPPALLEDLKLAATEIVTNSIRHSGMPHDEAVALRIQIAGSFVRVEVRDAGPGFVPPPAPIEVDATTGRGLLVLDNLASDWGVSTRGGTLVWFEMVGP